MMMNDQLTARRFLLNRGWVSPRFDADALEVQRSCRKSNYYSSDAQGVK
jgi:hypothetical protein